jgi:NSS family neurotransmitter:Na+ symporter
MVLGGLLFTIFVGWKMSREDVRDELTSGGRFSNRIFPVLWFLIRYVAPLAVLTIFITNLVL